MLVMVARIRVMMGIALYRHLAMSLMGTNAQCADSEVRNAIERTPYIVVLKFHVFILISKSFNFRSSLDRILRYLTKT